MTEPRHVCENCNEQCVVPHRDAMDCIRYLAARIEALEARPREVLSFDPSAHVQPKPKKRAARRNG